MFELGEGLADAVRDMLLQSGFHNVETRLDTIDVQRVITAKL